MLRRNAKIKQGLKSMLTSSLSPERYDAKVISVVGLCHFLSHFYQFVLPPLSILIHQSEGYSLESLALLVSVFYGASFCLQLPVGFAVDRFGARLILIIGVFVLAMCTLLYGVFTSYPSLVILTIIAGAANSVFHPADYSILNASVKPEKISPRDLSDSVFRFGIQRPISFSPALINQVRTGSTKSSKNATSWSAISTKTACGIACE